MGPTHRDKPYVLSQILNAAAAASSFISRRPPLAFQRPCSRSRRGLLPPRRPLRSVGVHPRPLRSARRLDPEELVASEGVTRSQGAAAACGRAARESGDPPLANPAVKPLPALRWWS